MAPQSTTSQPRPRSLVLTVVAGIILVVVFALIFAIAAGTRKITANAEALHDADEMLRAATTARAQIALAVIIANVDSQFGTISTEAIETSMRETNEALEQFDQGMRELEKNSIRPIEGLGDAGHAFVEATNKALLLTANGQSTQARTFTSDTLDPAFRALQTALVTQRGLLDSNVEASDRFLGGMENVARFLVAFLVPTAVILLYRELMRRQQRQTELEGRLTTERALGKAREDFIANASHELRTPLTSIYGLALLLEEDEVFQESSTGKELLDMIISESADLSRMVEDLLTTARLDADALHYAFENVSVIEEVEEVVGPMVRAGVNITSTIEPAAVRADRLRLRQALRNLLSNARKYGGPEIHIDGQQDGSSYAFTVADNGDGIRTELESRLFQRYLHQGHQPMVLGSVGLGLSIVRALAEGMGGSVGYERQGGLTKFSVRLPLVAAGAHSAPVLAPEGGEILTPDGAWGPATA